MEDKRKTLLLNLAASVGIVLCGLLIGTVGRNLFAERAHEDGEDTVSEVVTPEGQTMTALAYQPESAADRQQAVDALSAYGIESIFSAEKVMVKPAQTKLAMDCLSALGMVPGTEHFTISDITADPKKEPRRFEFQQRLAAQNMLPKMFEMLSPAVESAKVMYLPAGKNGSKVRVTLRLKKTVALTPEEKAEMIHEIIGMSADVQEGDIFFVDEKGNELK